MGAGLFQYQSVAVPDTQKLTKLFNYLHASLKKESPHINSRIFRNPQNPELLKLKKLLLLAKTEEKQQCCQTNKAMSPSANKMKNGMYKKVIGLSVRNRLP